MCEAVLLGDAISMEFSSIRKAFGQMLLLATVRTDACCSPRDKMAFDYRNDG
jgi:hypothetical protein